MSYAWSIVLHTCLLNENVSQFVSIYIISAYRLFAPRIPSWMSETETSDMHRVATSRIHTAANSLAKIFFKPNSNLPYIQPGGLTHILKPLDKSIAKTTIASAPTNPVREINPYQHKVPDMFYSPDFDTTQFTTSFTTWALRVPATLSTPIMKICRNEEILVSTDKVRSIVDDIEEISVPFDNTAATVHDKALKRIVLNRDKFPTSHTAEEVKAALPPSLHEFFAQGIEVVPQEVRFNYNYFTADQVLTSLLPENVTIPSGFALVGHIAHVNLRDEQLPYKHVIGRVITDKNNAVETVVNKVGMIDNVYRNFQAEILHGKDSLVAKVKEHNLTFEFDFSEVYWNSRLHTEHTRVVDLICALAAKYNDNQSFTVTENDPKAKYKTGKKGTITTTKPMPPFVLDLFAGVGPFVLPAAQRQCVVWGSDLNPRSSLYMYRNVMANKLRKHATVFNSCGRTLMAAVARQQMVQLLARVQWLQKRGVNLTFQSITNTDNPSIYTVVKQDIFGKEISRETATLSELPPGITVGNAYFTVFANDTPVKDNILCLPIDASTLPASVPAGATLTTTDAGHVLSLPLFYSSAFANSLPLLLHRISTGKHTPFFHHTIMNLPASAVTFLDMYRGVYAPTDLATMPVLPPVIDDAHAELIAGMPVTDERHGAETLNRLAVEAKAAQESRKNPTSAPEIPSATPLSLADTYDEDAAVAELGEAHSPPSFAALAVAGLRPLTVHCYCFARSAQDPHGDGLNMAEKELGYALLGTHRVFRGPGATTDADNIDKVEGSDAEGVDNKYRQLRNAWVGLGSTVTVVPGKKSSGNSENSGAPKKAKSADPTLPLHYDGAWAGDRVWQEGLYVHYVRNVAPLKEMMCVEALMGENVLCDTGAGRGGVTATMSSASGEGVAVTMGDSGKMNSETNIPAGDDEESDGSRKRGSDDEEDRGTKRCRAE